MKQNLSNYNHKECEPKWQKTWDDAQVFKFDENSAKPKFYELEMLPYPSGKIHMGHLRNYAIGDVIARFKMMQGFNVLHPMGFDAFGLPAENAALQHKIHPEKWTLENIETMRAELKTIGLSIDWSREIATCLPDYYKHEQKIFLDFLKAGLAYQKESLVNWDPIDNTVLANEQVIDGRGWRSGALVEKKKLRQWFLKISDFSEELLQELKVLNGWDERVLTMQEKWIGKSEGLVVDFKLSDINDKIQVYTTRPDTLFGAAFIAISAHHPVALKLAQNNSAIKEFIAQCDKNAIDEQTLETQEKKGVATGLQVEHPLDSNWKIDVYVANFVLMDYGTGAVFGCPAHDARDFEFAIKYNLPIKQVVAPLDSSKNTFASQNKNLTSESINSHISTTELPFLEDGIIINSDFLNGLTCEQAQHKVAEILCGKNQAQRKTNFRLRDWGVSRQRYWGCPIPILYLEDGSAVPVPQDQLPVELPKDVVFTGTGNPLANHPTWKHTTYTDASGKTQKAIRETDTFDTFFESSWYFLRYISKAEDKAFDRDVVNKFMPVDQYVGGIEHAVLHLLYARFFTKALKKCGYLDFSEPFKNLLTQGMVCHHTFKNQKGEWVFPSEAVEVEAGKFIHEKTREALVRGRSEKMSKSKKNVVEPLHIVEAYGADTARLFMLSDSPASRDLEWSESGVDGAWKYVNRLWKLVASHANQIDHGPLQPLATYNEEQLQIIKLTHKTIAMVGDEFEKIGFNRAIAKIREFSNALEKFATQNDNAANQGSSNDSAKKNAEVMHFALTNLVILFAPIMPHLAEECWAALGNKNLVTQAKFPQFDGQLISENSVKIAVQVMGKLRAVLEMSKGASREDVELAALQNENVQKFLEGKTAKKIIAVPDKMINFVL